MPMPTAEVPRPFAGPEPTINEAATALFTEEEREKLRTNLVEVRIRQAKYLRAHPEIDLAMRMAIGELVKAHPDDAVGFLTNFFAENDLEALVQAEESAEAERQFRGLEVCNAAAEALL